MGGGVCTLFDASWCNIFWLTRERWSSATCSCQHRWAQQCPAFPAAMAVPTTPKTTDSPEGPEINGQMSASYWSKNACPQLDKSDLLGTIIKYTLLKCAAGALGERCIPWNCNGLPHGCFHPQGEPGEPGNSKGERAQNSQGKRSINGTPPRFS